MHCPQISEWVMINIIFHAQENKLRLWWTVIHNQSQREILWKCNVWPLLKYCYKSKPKRSHDRHRPSSQDRGQGRGVPSLCPVSLCTAAPGEHGFVHDTQQRVVVLREAASWSWTRPSRGAEEKEQPAALPARFTDFLNHQLWCIVSARRKVRKAWKAVETQSPVPSPH